jgi:xanthine dehydrogenase YagR molybdenum-binding subunit
VIARGGRLVRRDEPSRGESYADILGRAGLAQIEGRGTGGNPNPMEAHAPSDHAMHAHGAVFAEIKVDPDLGQMRTMRLVGAFAAGRIINPRMVQSQLYGGIVRAA